MPPPPPLLERRRNGREKRGRGIERGRCWRGFLLLFSVYFFPPVFDPLRGDTAGVRKEMMRRCRYRLRCFGRADPVATETGGLKSATKLQGSADFRRQQKSALLSKLRRLGTEIVHGGTKDCCELYFLLLTEF